jgi:hypothetical protein
MIRAAHLHDVLEAGEYVPQAILAVAVETLAKSFGAQLVSDHDDLDGFVGAGFWLDDTPFAIMHYHGHPADTATIYLPRQIADLESITELVHVITSEFCVPDDLIRWQRKNNPSL